MDDRRLDSMCDLFGNKMLHDLQWPTITATNAQTNDRNFRMAAVSLMDIIWSFRDKCPQAKVIEIVTALESLPPCLLENVLKQKVHIMSVAPHLYCVRDMFIEIFPSWLLLSVYGAAMPAGHDLLINHCSKFILNTAVRGLRRLPRFQGLIRGLSLEGTWFNFHDLAVSMASQPGITALFLRHNEHVRFVFTQHILS